MPVAISCLLFPYDTASVSSRSVLSVRFSQPAMGDVITSYSIHYTKLYEFPDRVAIYGWHRPDGRPIQPLSTVHGFRYADRNNFV